MVNYRYTMNKLLLSVFSCLLLSLYAPAQTTRYIVRLKDKGNSPYSFTTPLSFLSQRAIDRRIRYALLPDSTDLPVTPSYISQLRSIPNVTVLNVSRWLNAVSVQTTDPAALNSISALPFVQSVSGLASRNNGSGRISRNKFAPEEEIVPLPPVTAKQAELQDNYFNYGSNSLNEIRLHNGEFLHNIGLRGQGMQIALLDGGFFNYTGLKAFDSANANGQIMGTWDFVAREQSVTEDHPHGMQCLSTIAANIPGQFVGKAPKASFWLFRTEDVSSEFPIEEFNWVCGAERADSCGADIISSSLGYYDFDNAAYNYTYSQLDGNTTLAAKGADLAAKKGILVFNSVGNEGGNAWNYLVTPSDGDSVVAVGAVSAAGVVGNFSSYGPSGDGQVKPDMASVGVAALVQTSSNTIGASNGTSFACPNMAGLGSLLWQAFPEFNNMKIVRVLRESGNKYSSPDNRTGYGIPDMKKAFATLLTEYASSTATVSSCVASLTWNSKDMGAMRYEIERKAPGESVFSKVGDLAAQTGNQITARSYTYTHSLAGLSPGTVSYRIRQIIDTSAAGFTAVYIDTASTSVEAACLTFADPLTELLVLQPNPVSGSFVTLRVQTPDAIPSLPVRVTDALGRVVWQQEFSKAPGLKTIDIPLNGLQKAQYFVSIYAGKRLLRSLPLIRL